MESQGSLVDPNEPTNTGMVEQTTGAQPNSDDEENAATQVAGITLQTEDTFEKEYFGKYPSLERPGSKYEDVLGESRHGQFVPEEEYISQREEPDKIFDQVSNPSRTAARKNLFEKHVSFGPSTK